MAKELYSWSAMFRKRPLTSRYKFVWLDAQYEKTGQYGMVQSFAACLAIELNAESKSEILGASGKRSEAEIHWVYI